MIEIEFFKYSGAGNDFVIIDNENDSIGLNNEQIRLLCNRRFGIGADGVIIINKAESNDFSMEFYNSDGNKGSLCGNGARCILMYFAKKYNKIEEFISFEFAKNIYSGKVLETDEVEFYLNQPEMVKFHFKVKAGNQMINAAYVDNGSPHLVILIKDILENEKNLNSFYKKIEEVPVYNLGKEIRNLKEFSPNGVNVNFINIREEFIEIRTFERGVEDETFACGTGSVAAAIIANRVYGIETPIKLKTKSGRHLSVNFEFTGFSYDNLLLKGPAEFIFEGKIEI